MTQTKIQHSTATRSCRLIPIELSTNLLSAFFLMPVHFCRLLLLSSFHVLSKNRIFSIFLPETQFNKLNYSMLVVSATAQNNGVDDDIGH